MEQKVPIISINDIERIIKRDFPKVQFTEVMNILNNYISETENGKYRIQASVLRLSDGNIELVKKNIGIANNDYRNVISLSEYPNYSEYAIESDLSEEEENKLIEEDWIQYRTWFDKI